MSKYANREVLKVTMKALLLLLLLLSLPVNAVAIETMKVCVDPDWPPYERLSETGEYEGIAADLFARIASRSGVTYEIVPTKNWDESIAFSQSGQCDALAFLNQTQEREAWLVFTDPYFTDPNVIIARETHEYVNNLAAFSGETMALPKGSSVLEKVTRDYPDIVVVPVESEKDAFKLVSQGDADMTLRSLTMAVHTIKNEGWFNLKVAGEVPAYANFLRVGVRKEDARLRDALNHGIATLTPKEVREVISNHLAIAIETSPNSRLIKRISIGFALAALVGLVWMIYQRRINARLNAIAAELEVQLHKQEVAQRDLKASQMRYQTLIEEAREGIVVAQHEKIVYSNPSFLEITGYDKQEVENLPIDQYLHEEDKPRTMQNYHKRVLGKNPENRYPVRFVTKSGVIKWVEISGVLIEWDGAPATLNFVIDITERVKQEENMRHMAQHDQLTGLANRWLLDDRLDRLLAHASREKTHFAVVFVDLNAFKPVNDKHGHEAGDMLLIEVAGRIKALLRESDTVARVGGDEFVVVLSTLASQTDVNEVVGKIQHVLREPFHIMAQTISISCAAGVAVYPKDGQTRSDLYRVADKAMYAQKEA